MKSSQKEEKSVFKARSRSAPDPANRKVKRDKTPANRNRKRIDSKQKRRSRSVPIDRRTEVQVYLRAIERKRREIEREEREIKLERRMRERERKLMQPPEVSVKSVNKRNARQRRAPGSSYLTARKSRRCDVTSLKNTGDAGFKIQEESIPSLRVVVRSRKLR